MKKIIFLTLFILGNSFGFAQVMKNYDKVFGGDGFDKPVDVYYKQGKSYVFGTIQKTGTSAGNITQSFGKLDYALVIYDNTGAKIKDVCFGGNRNDSLIKVLDLDSVFVLVGWSCSDNGTGNKSSDNSVLNNNSLDVTNSNPVGPYKEIYCVMVDLDGDIVQETSIPVTQQEYASVDPNDLVGLGNMAKNSPALVDNTDPSNPFTKFNYLLSINGVDKSGSWIKIMTSETARIKVAEFNYTTGYHSSGSTCIQTSSLNTGYDIYDLGCQTRYYSISTDLSQYTVDKENFTDYRHYDPNKRIQLTCPNNCPNPSIDLTWHYRYDFDLSSTGGWKGHYDYIGNEYVGPSGEFSMKVGLPIIKKAWYEPGQGFWFYKSPHYVTYADGSGTEKVWPGKIYQTINGAVWGSPNNILGEPVDMIFYNNKMYVVSIQDPNPSSTFNTSTPLPPGGVSNYTYVSFLRNMTAAPGTGLTNKKDIWITEHNYTIYTYTTITSPEIYQGYTMSYPLRQASIRANDNILYTSASNVMDTAKVFFSLSTQGSQQFDKRNSNKGGIDYWPVKFNFNNMRVVWDTTIGGVGEDILSAVKYENGILVLTGKSKSNIGQDKTGNSYDLAIGDFWTVNYCLPPKIDFIGYPLVLNPGGTVTFSTVNTNAGEFNWSFSDNSNSFDQNPSHYFYTPGWYSIDLIASNGVCQTISSKPNYVYVNGFSGINELGFNQDQALYPNPTSGQFYLHPKAKIIDIINVVGENVDYVVGNGVIDISASVPGIYFVRYEYNESRYSTKLVKN